MLKDYGTFTIDNLKSNLKSNDEDFKKLEQLVLKKKEDQLINDIHVLK